jgi:hypothetical protein
MIIFQKLFNSSRNKQELVSKLYGWDDEFAPLLFEIKQVRQVSVEQMKSVLGLDRRTSKSRNFYNKLKLLLGELMRLNC